MLIVPSNEAKKRICEKFNVHYSTLSYALRFKTNSELSAEMRSYAVNILQAPYVNVENYEGVKIRTR